MERRQSHTPPSYSRADALVAVGVGLAAFALYLWTLAPGLLYGDAGEVQFAVPALGLLHPTGYPLFTLLGWLWAHLLPPGDMAWRMNAFSAFWGGVAAGLTYLVAWQVIGLSAPLAGWPRRAVAAVAALLFATSPTFWSQAVIAEVYTLHLAFVALIFWLTFHVGSTGSARGGAALALAFGLSLTHHRTTLLLLPALAAYLWPGRPPTPRPPLPTGERGMENVEDTTHHPPTFALALLTITPLFLYTYILWRGEQSPYLHIRLAPDQVLHIYPPTWAGFLTWASGAGFAGALRSPAAALAQLPAAGRLLWGELGPLWALPCLTIILWVVHRRWRLLACTGLFALGQLAFNLFYGIGDVFVMYLPLYFIAAVWA
ncbi:MAG: DUF2723 domain-containing protein, partial [Anaerolineales bacterium]|nr:DUF2723 domain-containing protein [Anaerolineales bacterium]